MPHDDEKEEKEADDFCAQIHLSRRSVVAMDPGTPPSFDSEEPATMAKLSTSTSLPTRLVLKKVPAASDDSSRDEHASFLLPQKRKRRLHHFCYSSSDEEQTVFKGTRRKAWIDCQDSDNESETGSSSHHKICDEKEDLPLGVIQARAGSSGCQFVMAKYRPGAGRSPSLDEAPVFYPTEEEFQNTLKYIESIRHIAEPYGICRVVPPSSWHPPCALKDNAEEHLRFSTRVQKIHKLQVREPTTKACPNDEHVPKKRGRPRASKILKFSSDGSNASQQEYFGFEPGPTFTIKEFEGYAKELKDKYFRSEDAPSDVTIYQGKQIEPSIETIEGEFWRIVEKPTEQIEVLYGADIETNSFKSGFPKAKECERLSTAYERSGWNLNNIARLKDSVLEFEEGEISGVVVPWLYVGMCFSSFCWHVEDHHLYSVNYMHWGSPKIWYGVAGSAATKLEHAMKKRLPELFSEQPDLLHKLVTQLSPSILKEEGVPVCRVVQNAGEFVITFPRAYHAGFNCGFNCAEAVNVAPVDWLPHGQSAVELYKQQHRKTSISHDKLLLSAVKHAIKAVNHKLEESSESSSRRQILGKALKVRLDMEYSRRASLNGLKTRRMAINFDALEERECCVCSYDLHLSAVGCDCVPERYSCLEHARNLCGCSWGKKVAMYRYDLSELDEYLRVLQGHQGAMKLKIYGPKLPQQPDLQVETLESRMLKSYYASLNLANCGNMDSAISRDNVSISASNQVLIPRFPSGNDLMVESRSGPRVAKVVRPNKASSYDVELVHVGRLVMKSGWHNKNAILPAGFKSRVGFYNYLDLPQSCYYVSEILDCTDGKPLYKVSMEHRPSEKFVCSSIDLCWETIQERVNSEIKRLRQMGKTNLPPLKPPESLKGFDMFGFNMPYIVQDVEALDPMHMCADYWKERLHEPLTVSDNGLNHGFTESLFGMGDNEHRYTSLKGFLSKAGKNQLSELQQILNSKWAADSWFRT